jgi:hypothetical protein
MSEATPFEGSVPLEDVLVRAARLMIEAEIQRLIDLLDQMDARTEDREPDADDEIVCEDEGVVRHWSPACGRQA